eukprot:GHVU01149130.1.p2 GENE.GHVU01149130.1~~GHVU01149130.1.p2  ORF type:complete len:205 (+),score=58.78 GHVU01149130.1:692-1306(+)
MSFLAAMLLIYLPPFPAFVALCNLLNTPCLMGLFTVDPTIVARRYRIFESLLRVRSARLCAHLEEIGMMPDCYLLEWFLTIYAKPLKLEVASVVWDLFLLDGEETLFVAAVAILGALEKELLRADLDGARQILRDLHARLPDDAEFLQQMERVRTTVMTNDIRGQIRFIESIEFGSQYRNLSSCSDTTAAAAAAMGPNGRDPYW